VAATGAATLVMSYWNPIERYGVVPFADQLAAAGGVGVITPDLTPDEATPWLAAVGSAGLDPVFLVAPSSTDERIQRVAEVTRGFVYVASTMGVTGVRDSVSDLASRLVARTRQLTSLPLAVGLGVSTGAQAAEVAAYADGVIVGSAFVRRLIDAPTPAAGVDAVRQLAAELAVGVRSGR
jgi:tryptophan synthase alpha chain